MVKMGVLKVVPVLVLCCVVCFGGELLLLPFQKLRGPAIC